MKDYYKMLVYSAETTDNIQWNVEFPDIKGVGGAGNTPEEAIKDAENNLKHYLIDELEEIDKKNFNLFCALADILLKEQDSDNIPTKIDFLTQQNNSSVADKYAEYCLLKQNKNSEFETFKINIYNVLDNIKTLTDNKVLKDYINEVMDKIKF